MVADSHKMLKRKHHRQAATEGEDHEAKVEAYSDLTLDWLFALFNDSDDTNNTKVLESAIRTKLEINRKELTEKLEKKKRDIADWEKRLHFDPGALGEAIRNAEAEILLLEQEIEKETARVEAEMERRVRE